MDGQLSFDDYAEAKAKRDAAVASVAAHADENVHGWTSQAGLLVERYASMHLEFIAEDCADFAYAEGLQKENVDGRAWGKVYRAAAKAGVIKKVGYGVSQKRNFSPTVLWRSCHPKFREAV